MSQSPYATAGDMMPQWNSGIPDTPPPEEDSALPPDAPHTALPASRQPVPPSPHNLSREEQEGLAGGDADVAPRQSSRVRFSHTNRVQRAGSMAAYSDTSSSSLTARVAEEPIFDPTETHGLKHVMRVQVTRDGKPVEEDLDPYELARLYGQREAALRSMHSNYDFLSVPDWVRIHPLLGTYLAEALGTFAWVLTLSLTSVRNQSIFSIADDTNMTALPIGFMFTSMIFTFGYISGGHFNPAISVAVFLIRRLELVRCMAYILVQMGAALGAGLVAMLIQGSSDIFVPSVSNSYVSSGIFSELIFTFALCIVVLNIAYSRQTGNFFYGFAVGMTMAAGSASVGRISGGAFNPAAATGLQVAMCLAGNCDDLKSVWIYWLAPIAGAVLASILYSQMAQPVGTQVLQDHKVFADVTRSALRRGNAATVVEGSESLVVEETEGVDHEHEAGSDSSSTSPSDAEGEMEERNRGAVRREDALESGDIVVPTK